jgi:hypothetical protein
VSENTLNPDRILQFPFAFAAPLIIEAAVRHGVFDALDAGPRGLDDLVQATGASLRGLRALLNGLVGIDLARKEGEAYALTPESAAYLVSTKPEYLGGIFRHVSRQLLPNWLGLADSVRSGRPSLSVNREQGGAEFFREFVEDLFPRMHPAARVLAQELRLSQARSPVSVLDLAAGSAVWSITLAEASPHVRATVVDWPEVLPVAKRVTARHGVADRFRFVAGDVLSADYGSGHQVAVLGHILHSEGPQRSREILRRVFGALAPGGSVAIAEFLVDEDRSGPSHALVFAVNMLVHTDEGDAFTFGEIAAWLQEAGFAEPRLLEAPAPSPLILAQKPT